MSSFPFDLSAPAGTARRRSDPVRAVVSAEGGAVLACWSVKGGSGTTVVAAALAASAAASPAGCLLVDLGGDAGAALGCSERDAAGGLASWLAAATPDVGAFGRLAVEVTSGLSLVPRGRGPLAPQHLGALTGLLAAEGREVVVDCGTFPADEPPPEVAAEMAAGATRSLLVLRPCFLALRRAVQAPLRPSGVVLVAEGGRALQARDVSGVLGVPVVAEVPVDAAVARAVDAGLLATRLPRSLGRALRALDPAA